MSVAQIVCWVSIRYYTPEWLTSFLYRKLEGRYRVEEWASRNFVKTSRTQGHDRAVERHMHMTKQLEQKWQEHRELHLRMNTPKIRSSYHVSKLGNTWLMVEKILPSNQITI
jgi:hypothetical protein